MPPPRSTPRRGEDFRSLTKRLENSEVTKLTTLQVENYVEAQHRSAESLLAAYRLSGDETYMTEALARFPNNPQVLLSALRLAPDPAKRLELLEAFKLADPDNGIANCLAAKALFDLGRTEEGLAELFHARGKPIDDFKISS